MIRRHEIIPVPGPRRRVPLPLAIFFGAVSLVGFLMLAGFIWFVAAFAFSDWRF